MILLDTNVISEPLRQAPARAVIEWIDAHPLETMFLAAITVAELRAGVALLSSGTRKTGLHQDIEMRVLPLFAAVTDLDGISDLAMLGTTSSSLRIQRNHRLYTNINSPSVGPGSIEKP